MILEQKGTRMAEDGEDWNGLEMTILKSLAIWPPTFGFKRLFQQSHNNTAILDRKVLELTARLQPKDTKQ